MAARFRRQSLHSLLVGYLAVSLCGPTGTVLCLGADGHMGIERQASGRCIPGATKDSHARPEVLIADDLLVSNDCGPCTDIPLSVHGDADVPGRVNSRSLVKARPGDIVCGFGCLPSREGGPSHDPVPSMLPLGESRHLNSLRGVILLI